MDETSRFAVISLGNHEQPAQELLQCIINKKQRITREIPNPRIHGRTIANDHNQATSFDEGSSR